MTMKRRELIETFLDRERTLNNIYTRWAFPNLTPKRRATTSQARTEWAAAVKAVAVHYNIPFEDVAESGTSLFGLGATAGMVSSWLDALKAAKT